MTSFPAKTPTLVNNLLLLTFALKGSFAHLWCCKHSGQFDEATSKLQ